MPGRIEQAIQDVLAAVGTIKTANGYANDVKTTGRHPIPPDSLSTSQLPAVFVAKPEGVSGRTTPLDGTAYKELVTLGLIGVVRGGAKDPEAYGLATRAESLLSDLKTLANADPKFGSAVIHDSHMVENSNDAAWDAPGGVVGLVIELIVLWDTTKTP